MPGILTHKTANEVLFKRIENKEIRDIVSRNFVPYIAAAQGTDCFYFYHYGSLTVK